MRWVRATGEPHVRAPAKVYFGGLGLDCSEYPVRYDTYTPVEFIEPLTLPGPMKASST